MTKYPKIIVIIILVSIIVSGNPVQADINKDINVNAVNTTVERISGDNRVETSIEVSKKAYAGKVETLFLAGYSGDADALTATFMAGEMDAPLLISDKIKISTKLAEEIKRLNPKEIIILGGTNAVSQRIEDELKEKRYNTRRIKGNSRIETAVNVAEDYYKDKQVNEVFIVEYDSLVDALAIGPVAAKTGTPVLITRKDLVPKEIINFIENKGVEKITIVGGEGTVSKKGMERLKKYVKEVDRVYGNDRIETSLNIAKEYFENPKVTFIANGWKNADALIGGYFAGMENAPILLTKQNSLKDNISNYLTKGLEKSYILGGEAVLNSHVYDLLDWSLSGRGGVKPIPKPEVKPEKPQEIPSNKIFTDKKEIRDIIVEKMKSRQDKFTITISPKFTLEEINKLTENLESDGSYYMTIGLYLANTTMTKDKTVINLYYDNGYTPEQSAFIDKEVKRIVSEIISPGMNEFQKVKAIHDYIVNNTSYSFATVGSPYSDYTLLKEGKGVCNAYALATSRFLDEINIDNYFISGEANNSTNSGYAGHAWNKVKVDGDWYNMDTTWDDPLASIGTNYLRYKYFLISDEKINKDHKADRKTPEATDKRYEILEKVGSNPVEYEGNFYYYNRDDNSSIYKIALSDLIPEKISDLRTYSLVVYDDIIYFSHAWRGGSIHSMDMDGNNVQQLNSVYSTKLKVEYPYIKYHAEDEGIWEKIDIR